MNDKHLHGEDEDGELTRAGYNRSEAAIAAYDQLKATARDAVIDAHGFFIATTNRDGKLRFIAAVPDSADENVTRFFQATIIELERLIGAADD